MKTAWLDVALFDEQPSGRSFESVLREKRIDARTYKDKPLERMLFLWPPRALFRVQVREHFFKMTTDALKKVEPAILQEAIHCPACGSWRVDYPHLARRSVLLSLLVYLGTMFRLVRHQAYCETCNHLWSLPRAGGTAPLHPLTEHPGH
jgi:hypothetical protein